ncbi:MAG: sulfotransferase, partial [Longimicrobiales bacterium]|nr:sulfotransferase [Longimicrobiales bacterium]
RIARVRREFGWFHRMTPDYQAAHPIGPELGQECMAITELSFESPRFDRTHRLPDYRDWLSGRDRLHSYRIHREVLQHLSWRGPRGRWVLKNPPHSFWLDALWTLYPDALFVQTHRDPFTVMASFASHNSRIRRSFTRPDDAGEGPVIAERWAMGMERVIAFRDRADVPADRWIDIAYPDLIADPVGEVSRIYSHFGLPLEATTESRIRAWAEAHPQYEFGVHDYDPRRFGLDPERHGALFARYRERFEIEPTAEDRRLVETGSKGVGR